ncbi:hypothetical protein Tco_1012288 [Tanacetum coccineum]
MIKKSHNPYSHADDTPLGNKVYRLERKVEALSKFNIQAAIDKSVEARLKQIKLPKGIPDFKKIKLEKVAKQNVPKTSWNKTATAIYDKKKRVVSLSINEDDMDRIFGKSCQTKRKTDDHDKDPSLNADKDPKKRSCIELKYHLKQRYLPFSDKLDWNNPEGNIIHQYFSKPLPLLSAHGRQYIPAEFFFNKDLEYLRTWNLEERKYTASFTKTKATRYEFYGIKEMIQGLWSPYKVAYDKDATFGIKYSGYGYLKEIVVKRANQKEYVFKEADFLSLHLNYIEDTFLLYYQNKLYHLYINIQTHLAVALWFFIRITILKHRVEDVQLGVESYQTKLNLVKPQVSAYGVATIFYKPKGDELQYRLNNVQMGYSTDMSTRPWSDKDKRRAKSMVNVIKKTLHKRRIIRSLECYVGRRKHEADYRLLTRTD